MYCNKGFKGMEQWKRENEKGEGGGRLLSIKGARYDDHSDKAKQVEEKRRQYEKRNCYNGGINR